MTNDQTNDHGPQVPETVREIIDTAFHRHHDADGPVMRCAADVVAEVHRLDIARIRQVEAEQYGPYASGDFAAGLHFALRALAASTPVTGTEAA
jgi:hypothetical protein